jgi:hypothetical protein
MMKHLKGEFVCQQCGAIEKGRKPVKCVCLMCLAKQKGVDPFCACCKVPLSRKRIAGLVSNRKPILYCSRQCLGKACAGENHPAYIGGRIIDKNGYAKLRRNGKYTQEHRVVIEMAIGRELKKWETVHHKDGNRLNNSLDNLELMGTRHPKGQLFLDWVDNLSSKIIASNPRCVVSYHIADSTFACRELLVTNVDSGQQVIIPLV